MQLETLAGTGILLKQYTDSKRASRRLTCDGFGSRSYMFVCTKRCYLQNSCRSNEIQDFSSQHAIVCMQKQLHRKIVSTWNKDIYAEEIPKSDTAKERKEFFGLFFVSISEVQNEIP